MNSAALVGIVESRELVDILTAELTRNLGTSHYRRIHPDDLFQRVSVVYGHLAQWLRSRDESQLRQNGEELGRSRFAEGVPLGQVILALILNEKYLWKLVEKSQVPIDAESRALITEFFQKHTYYTGKGYEMALAASHRSADRIAEEREMAVASSVPPKKAGATARPEQDMEISRGGQVGEHGG